MINVRTLGREAQEKLIAEMQQNDGKFTPISFGSEFETGKMTIAEMIGTDDGAREFIEKITYDMATGRDAVPLVYKEIYSTITDPNFPETFTAKTFGNIQVAFLQKFEGGEIKFGTMGAGTEKKVSMLTWAAGVEYNEDIVEYNKTWQVADIGQAFGEAYNKILNHLHMYPIVSAVYVTTAGGLAGQRAKQTASTAPAAQLVAYDTTIQKTLQNALTIMPEGARLLVNSYDIPALEAAIAADMLPDNSAGQVKRRLRPSDFIVYDGNSAVVGGQTYTYTGVTAGECYLIAPKTQFVEYIKHELRVDSGDGDLSRLILAQVVGRTRRGVFAGLTGSKGVIKVDISA